MTQYQFICVALPGTPARPRRPHRYGVTLEESGWFSYCLKICQWYNAKFPHTGFSGPHRFRSTLPSWHRPTGFGEPISSRFSKFLHGTPPHLNFVFIQIFTIFTRATPRCASAGYAHCQLIVFTRFYPNYGPPSPELLHMFSLFCLTHRNNYRICTPISSTYYTLEAESGLLRYNIFSSHPQRAIFMFTFSRYVVSSY